MGLFRPEINGVVNLLITGRSKKKAETICPHKHSAGANRRGWDERDARWLGWKSDDLKQHFVSSCSRWIPKPFTRWWFIFILLSSRSLAFHDPIWRAYFADGLVQPPTRLEVGTKITPVKPTDFRPILWGAPFHFLQTVHFPVPFVSFSRVDVGALGWLNRFSFFQADGFVFCVWHQGIP